MSVNPVIPIYPINSVNRGRVSDGSNERPKSCGCIENDRDSLRERPVSRRESCDSSNVGSICAADSIIANKEHVAIDNSRLIYLLDD